MEVAAFLEQFIERYLFADLETLKTAGPSQPLADGHVGYPTFMACAAGIEVLGLLISPDEYTKESSGGANGPSRNFVRYWSTYLYPDEPRSLVGDAIFQLVRNGVAHTFAAKAPTISKRGAHLERIDGVARVNVVTLANDFRKSYADNLRPILDGTKAKGKLDETKASLQMRLDELLTLDAKKIDHHSPVLEKLPDAGERIAGINVGATGHTRIVALDTAIASSSDITGSVRAPNVGAVSNSAFPTGSPLTKK
jgi:hypothetical protein